VAFIANTPMDLEIDGRTESARTSAFRRRLRADDYAAAVDLSANMLLAGESDR